MIGRHLLTAGGATVAGTTLVAVILLGAVTTTPKTQDDPQQVALTDPICEVTTGGPNLSDLSGAQSRNVRAIYAAAITAKQGPQGAVIGVATAMQESMLRVLASQANSGSLRYPHDGVAPGDHDSVGLFQQRDLWGPMVDRMNALTSSRMFFTGGQAGQRGLKDVPGWRFMSPGEAAQAVQVSAYPTAYQQWTPMAVAAVRAVQTGAPVQVAGCSSTSATTTGWTTPVPSGQYRLSSGFGARLSPGGVGSTNHQGLDFAAPTGTRAQAAAAGTVKIAGPSSGFGLLVTVENGGGIVTFYGHLSAVLVRPGQHVNAADQIGRVGSTGKSTGPHLHFQVTRSEQPIDPRPWLIQHGVTI